MKGHMEKDGFHPHTQYKGIRKSRDQLTKTEGVKIRKQREVSTENLPSVEDTLHDARQLKLPFTRHTKEQKERALLLVGKEIYDVEWFEERDLAMITVSREADGRIKYRVDDPEEIRDLIEQDGAFKHFGDTSGLMQYLLDRELIDPDMDGALIRYNVLTDPDRNSEGATMFVDQIFAYDEDEAEAILWQNGYDNRFFLDVDRLESGGEITPFGNPYVEHDLREGKFF